MTYTRCSNSSFVHLLQLVAFHAQHPELNREQADVLERQKEEIRNRMLWIQRFADHVIRFVMENKR